MASSVVLKKVFSSNLLFSKLALSSRPVVATDVFGRFSSSINRRLHSGAEYSGYEEVPFTKKEITPRSFKREDPTHVYLYLDLPGITKEDIEANVEPLDYDNDKIRLQINAEAVKDYECESRNYTSSFDLPRYKFKTSKIKANIKDGVLKVTLPKLKEVNQEDIFQEELKVEVD